MAVLATNLNRKAGLARGLLFCYIVVLFIMDISLLIEAHVGFSSDKQNKQESKMAKIKVRKTITKKNCRPAHHVNCDRQQPPMSPHRGHVPSGNRPGGNIMSVLRRMVR